MDVFLTFAVPIIAVGIWVLGNLMNRGNEPVRNLPQGRPGTRPRPATSEIDRFLEEVNRRRQAQQQQQQRPVRREEPVTVQPVDEDEDVFPSAPPPPPPPRPAPPPPVVVQRPRPAPPPVVRRPVAQPVIVVPVVEPVVEVRKFEAPPPPPPAVPAARIQRAVPVQLLNIRNMLRSPGGMRTAIVLSEILGPPKSQRRRPSS